MDKLESIKSSTSLKRILKGVHFDWSGAEITYTDGLGACSGHNDIVLAKSVDKSTGLTEEQKAILDQIGKQFTPLEKSIEVSNTRKTKPPQEGNEIEMTEDLKKQIAAQAEEISAMKLQTAVKDATQEVKIFGFDEVIQKELVDVMVSSENSEAIIKALTHVKETQVVVEKEIETNPFVKSLLEAKGDSALAEQPAPEGEMTVLKSLQELMTAQAEGAK